MVDAVLALPEGTRLMVLAPVVRDRKGEFVELFADMQAQGYVRFRIGSNGQPGQVFEAGELPKLKKNEKHDIDVVIDRLRVQPGLQQRLAESFEAALRIADGRAIALEMDSRPREHLFSSKFGCPVCSYSLSELEPRLFSFNSPVGACPSCDGLGQVTVFDAAARGRLSRPEPGLGRGQGLGPAQCLHLLDAGKRGPALRLRHRHALRGAAGEARSRCCCTARATRTSTSSTRPQGAKGARAHREALAPLRGHPAQPGAALPRDRFGRGARGPGALPGRQALPGLRRLAAAARGAQRVPAAERRTSAGEPIYRVEHQTLADCLAYFEGLQLQGAKAEIADKIVREIRSRLKFLNDVGLNYLSLDRSADTLSGGEAQRIRLASQIGSGLTGVMYVLDEPRIGLHQRDNARLIGTLKRLRDLGNSVLVVEHDEDMIRAADHVVDMGPGAGVHGGRVIAQGTAADVAANAESLTGQYLARTLRIEPPHARATLAAQADARVLRIVNARGNNLKNVTAEIPVGLFTCVTGVSGSGKSTLVNDTLYAAVARKLYGCARRAGAARPDRGPGRLRQGDQRRPEPDRPHAAQQPGHLHGAVHADPRAVRRGAGGARARLRARALQLQRGGRALRGLPGRRRASRWRCTSCPTCTCPATSATARATTARRWRSSTRAATSPQVLDMTVEDAHGYFNAVPNIARKLQTLLDVGLGYIKLGQSATTLSGGEAQRVKLALELSKRDTGRTLYILDEPTTGLHFHDIAQLLKVLHQLRDAGNTIVVIEHNLDVIKTAPTG